MADEFEKIAVVGVGSIFPDSQDSTDFWEHIVQGRDLLRDVPETHWLAGDYWDEDPALTDTTYSKRGAFLEDIDFGPMEWGIPPNTIEAIDSAQLLTLLVASRVVDQMEKTRGEAIDRERASVILGVASGTEMLGQMAGRLRYPHWQKGLREAGLPEDQVEEAVERILDQFVGLQENTFPGLLGNVVAGRVANRLDLQGTNCTVDAACASTFAALEAAANKLRLGESDMVITGGVDALNDVFMYVCFSLVGALSGSESCRPFSASADGTMMGEGIGLFALKRLSDAEADGDEIYSVLSGMGSSSDGRAKSIYAPVAGGQALALKRAYESAGYGPETVGMVEAHGTATTAGDAAEFGGLRQVFEDEELRDEESEADDSQWCALGSVKSQIGHTKSAAAAAGMFKAVMALHHRVLPPTLHVDEPNPELELDDSPFYLNTESRPWLNDGSHPRRASVSSFGFGGTNFHATFEEYRGEQKGPRWPAFDEQLVLLSADSPEELGERVAELAEAASDEPARGWLRHLAWQSQHDFEAVAGARLSVVADDADDLASQLEQAAELIGAQPDAGFATPTGMHYEAGEPDEGDVGFLFPGQGAQYIGMGEDWAMHFEPVQETWERIEAVNLVDGASLGEVIYPQPAFTDEEKQAHADRLVRTEWAQPSIGAVSLGARSLMERLGVEPSCVAGHSYGEITALHAAGVLSEEDFLRVSRRRGELMAEAAELPGTMTSVKTTREELEAEMESWEADVVVANHNAPDQVVISGEVKEIERAEEALEETDWKYKRLPVDTAFHSPVVSGSAEKIRAYLDDVELNEPELPVYSNPTGELHGEDLEEIRDQIAEQLAKPVQFVDQIESMYERGVRTFVEVGPHRILSRLVDSCLEGRPHRTVALDDRSADGLNQTWEGLGKLAVSGVEMDFEALWDDYRAPADPGAVDEDSFTVTLSGANYNKPYPPEGGEAGLPEPNPPSNEAPDVAAGGQQAGQDEPRQPQRAQRPQQAQANQRGAGTMSDGRDGTNGRQGQNQQAAQPQQRQGQQPAMSASERAEWMRAFQEQQRHAAQVHREFQQTHRVFLETMRESFRGLTQVMSGQPAAEGERPPAPPVSRESFEGQASSAPPPQPAPRQQQPVQQQPQQQQQGAGKAARAPTQQQQPAPRQQQTQPQPQTQQQQPAPRQPQQQQPQATQQRQPQQSQPQPTQQTQPQQQQQEAGKAARAPEPESNEPAAASQPSNGEIEAPDINELMLETISDHTGYPTGMIDPSMNLEKDLGVDSIKQVEILSSVQDSVPGLPDIETSEIAELDTLGQIVEHIEGLTKKKA